MKFIFILFIYILKNDFLISFDINNIFIIRLIFSQLINFPNQNPLYYLYNLVAEYFSLFPYIIKKAFL